MKPKKEFIVLLIILAITAILYIPSLHGDFIFDDFNNIVYNYRILIKDLSPISLMQAITCTKGGIRPFAHLSFALNYYFFGINPFYFHIVNLVFHLINVILLFFFVKKLAIRLGKKDSAEKIGLISALIFATATIQTSAVSYIVQRMAVGMTMFSLISLILFLNRRYFYSFVSFLVALGFKENAVLIIPIIAYLMWIERGKNKKEFIYGLAFFTLAAIFILSPYGLDLFSSFQKGASKRNFTLWQRLITEPRIVFHYLSLIGFPYYKMFVLNYQYPLSTSLFSPLTTLLSIAGIIGMGVFSILCKDKYLSFLSGFFVISLAIENTIVPLDLAYEHRMYFPMIAISGILGYLFVKYAEKKWVPALVSLLIVANGVNTYMRNTQYRDYISILKQDLIHYPENVRALYNMYIMELKKGEKEKAIAYLVRCLNLNPKVYNVYTSYADYLSKTVSPKKGISYLKKILKEKKNINKPHLIMWKIAKLYEQSGESKKALKWYSEAMKKYPNSIKIRRDFGLFLFNNGNYYYGYLNTAKAYEFDNYNPLTVYYLAKMTKILKMKEKFDFFSNFYKMLYQEGKYYSLPKPEF